MAGPLAGIRVLDLSWILAGPYATMILSDLGAEVIKIEKPGAGDMARGNGPFIDGESAYFMSLNRGKKSLTLDLQKPPGKAIFLKLVEKADVVVENFLPGTMKRLGLDYKAVRRRNPAIIYASISGFGQTGPYAENRALDITIEAISGMMSLTGEPDGPPLKPGASLADISAGMYAATGILAALHERGKSGKGQHLDISMLDCQVSILENAFARHFATGETPQRLGTRHPTFTPFQTFKTKDGYIAVALVGGTRNQWPLFCASIGHIELIDDARYETGESRTAHYTELEPILCQELKKKTTNTWLRIFSELGIACGQVNDIAQAAAHPQVRAREMITEIPHQKLGKIRLVNSPIKLSRTPAAVKKPAPTLGQDTSTVLFQLLGKSTAEIRKLRASGII